MTVGNTPSSNISEAKQMLASLTDNPKLLYVICPFNIGDFLVNGGLCYALQVKKRKTSCALIVCDKFKDSQIDFIGVSQIIYIPSGKMELIKDYIRENSLYETDNYIYGHFHVKNGGYDWNTSLHFFDRYRENVFGLPLGTEILPPIIEDISVEQQQKLHAMYQLSKRTVIITPYANSSTQLFSDEVWFGLVNKLKALGYIVYTNVAGKELPIKGTMRIKLTFPELVYAAGKVKCFIGRRSGIFDLLCFTDAELLCILYVDYWHDDLRKNFPDKKSYAFYYAGHYKAVLENARKRNADDLTQVQLNVPHVDASEIYFEEDMMTDAIINTVKELE